MEKVFNDGETVQVIVPNLPEFHEFFREFKKNISGASYRNAENDECVVTWPISSQHSFMKALNEICKYKIIT